ncbi:GH19545 [Drosophila grimshawi]|uniref:GH19545 n=1 Tax=Drosophila grimshawi TaxID=7222 RepID=B4JHC1_DROGR|nr:GH19545 [Drosophila grimshawi]
MTTSITTGQAPPVIIATTTTTTTTTTGQPLPTTYVEVIEEPQSQRISNRWTNTQNAHAATLGLLLFAYGGMDMAQGLQWNLNTGITTTYQLEYSWFIGVIIGAVVAAFTVTHVPKKYLYLLAGILQLIDAIIFVSEPNDYTSIVAARYVGGVGIGLLTVAFIIHNSEVYLGFSRGKWCGLEQFGMTLGILIQVLMDSQWHSSSSSSITINEVHGIIGIVFAAFATSSVAMSVESPIFHLRQGDENGARTSQTHLLGTATPQDVYNTLFDEYKRYVMEGTSQSFGKQLASSVVPFIKMIFCRCLVAFSFSVPLSLTMLGSTLIWKASMLSWPMILWSILRFIGALLAICSVDLIGRKFVSLVGLLCMSALMLSLAGITAHDTYYTNTYFMSQVCRISMAFQFFAGLFVISTPTYLGEAFPMRVKPFLIGLVVCIEQLIHIIVIVTFLKDAYCFFQYFVGVGIILVVGLIIFGVLMPETRGLSLRQAGDRFRRVHDIIAY